MSTKEIEKRYLTVDGNHLNPIKRENAIREVKDLYDILDYWSKHNPASTIGDLSIMSKNKQLILLQIGLSAYYINADTRITGV